MSFFALPSVPIDFGRNQDELDIIRNSYCSISDVEERLLGFDLDLAHNTRDDYEKWVGKAIRRAERYIDGRTMTTFHKVKRREWHSGSLENSMLLDCYPIIEVTKVKVFSAALMTGFEYDPRAMVVDNEAGTVGFPSYMYGGAIPGTVAMNPMVLGFTYLPGVKNCEFEYWYGYDRVPDTGYHAGIRDATAMICAAILLEEAEARQSQGLTSLNIVGQGTQFGKWTFHADLLRKQAEPFIARYRRQTFGSISL